MSAAIEQRRFKATCKAQSRIASIMAQHDTANAENLLARSAELAQTSNLRRDESEDRYILHNGMRAYPQGTGYWHITDDAEPPNPDEGADCGLLFGWMTTDETRKILRGETA